MDAGRGIVVFGDVIHSRRDASASSEWLRTLRDALDDAYGDERLAPFGFTQGDELQGLLGPNADPLHAVLIGSLHAGRRPMRWAVSEGEVVPGSGPATERSGPAFLVARQMIERSRTTRDGLVIRTGDPGADRLLDRIAPPLAEMLDGLTDRQRAVAWLALVDGLRQAEVASTLRVSRATISVTYGRAHLRSIERLADAVRLVVNAARQALAEDHSPYANDGPAAVSAVDAVRPGIPGHETAR